MATYYVNAATGSDANAGSEAAPWLLIPGQTGANTVAAGSIIRIRNGLDYSAGGRIVPPANNITYEGYGLADNVLTLTDLPLGPRRVVQTPGVDEGMWILTNIAHAVPTSGMVTTNTRSGTVISDLYCDVLEGEMAGTTSTGVLCGTTGSTASGATLKRSWIRNAGYCVSGFTPGIVIDECRLERSASDCITFNGAAVTGYRAGSFDAITNSEIIDPGWDEAWAMGDGFQTTPTYAAHLTLANIYMRKPSAAKQAFVVCDATGGVEMSDVLIDGQGVGNNQINFTSVVGSIRVKRLTQRNALAGSGNPAIRVLADPSLLVVMGTGSTIDIRDWRIEGAVCERIFSWNATSTSGCSVDGVVSIKNVVAEGVGAATPLSMSALFSMVETAQVAVNANAQCHIESVTLNVTPNVPIVRFPTGSAADARFTFHNSRVPVGDYYIGATQYANLAAIEAAKTGMQTNVIFDAADNFGDADGPLAIGSALLGAGTHLGYRRDITGKQRPNPPSIGAYDRATLRRIVETDPAGW